MNDTRRIGVAVVGRDSGEVVERIQQAEEMGIPAAWLTTGGARQDGLSVLAAAAAKTERILLGTSIIPTWPRHPIALAQQARVINDLAPGRFRLGIGPSGKATIEGVFGIEYRAPLGHLREYVRILKALLQKGKVDLEGRYTAHADIGDPIDVPVMASALRRRSFELCGEEADGAITWVCPGTYNRDVAIPAIREGAQKAGRAVPPLIAHAPVSVHEDADEVRSAMREQMGNYPSNPNYAQMFADAGFPEAIETGKWSDPMIDAVVLYGDEQRVKERLGEMFNQGAQEIMVSPVLAGRNREASYERTMRLVAEVAREVGS